MGKSNGCLSQKTQTRQVSITHESTSQRQRAVGLLSGPLRRRNTAAPGTGQGLCRGVGGPCPPPAVGCRCWMAAFTAQGTRLQSNKVRAQRLFGDIAMGTLRCERWGALK